MQRVDADRSRGRLRTSSIGTQSSRRYVGATPLTHFHAIIAVLKMTRRRTGSLCRLRSMARRSHGVELLTQGELQHSGQPGVA